MAEISVTGESITEVAEETEKLQRLNELDDEELFDAYRDLKAVRDALRELTADGGTVRKREIKERADVRGHRYPLELLKALEQHDLAANSGQGGGWKYTRE